MLIGFGHRSGHGKDTAANYLVTHLNIMKPDIVIKKINLADKLKDVAYDLYKWAGVKKAIYYENNRDARSLIIPELNCTVVDLWVDIGEKMREIYLKTWIKYVKQQGETCDILISADVRHENEIEIYDLVYKVENPRIPRREGKSIDDNLEGFDAWSGVILNSGDHGRLNRMMEGLAGVILESYKKNEAHK